MPHIPFYMTIIDLKADVKNPRNCWPFFSMYIMYLITFISIVFTVILKIAMNLDYSTGVSTRISGLHIFEICSYLFAVLGFLIFSIKPTLVFIKHVFEELNATESFKKNVNILIRSQWFLLLLMALLLAMKDDFRVIEPAFLIVFLLNLIIDLQSIYRNFALNDKKVTTATNALSMVLGLFLCYTETFEVGFYYFVMKVLMLCLNSYTNVFISNVEDKKSKRRMFVLHILLVLNLYLVGYGLLRNMNCFSTLNVTENEMFLSIWNVMKLLFLPNLGKIVPYFL